MKQLAQIDLRAENGMIIKVDGPDEIFNSLVLLFQWNNYN